MTATDHTFVPWPMDATVCLECPLPERRHKPRTRIALRPKTARQVKGKHAAPPGRLRDLLGPGRKRR